MEKKLDEIQELDITEEVQEGPSGWMTVTEVKDCMVIVHEQHPIQFNLSPPIWISKTPFYRDCPDLKEESTWYGSVSVLLPF